jgi:hypothetical protein
VLADIRQGFATLPRSRRLVEEVSLSVPVLLNADRLGRD